MKNKNDKKAQCMANFINCVVCENLTNHNSTNTVQLIYVHPSKVGKQWN